MSRILVKGHKFLNVPINSSSATSNAEVRRTSLSFIIRWVIPEFVRIRVCIIEMMIEYWASELIGQLQDISVITSKLKGIIL